MYVWVRRIGEDPFRFWCVNENRKVSLTIEREEGELEEEVDEVSPGEIRRRKKSCE